MQPKRFFSMLVNDKIFASGNIAAFKNKRPAVLSGKFPARRSALFSKSARGKLPCGKLPASSPGGALFYKTASAKKSGNRREGIAARLLFSGKAALSPQAVPLPLSMKDALCAGTLRSMILALAKRRPNA